MNGLKIQSNSLAALSPGGQVQRVDRRRSHRIKLHREVELLFRKGTEHEQVFAARLHSLSATGVSVILDTPLADDFIFAITIPLPEVGTKIVARIKKSWLSQASTEAAWMYGFIFTHLRATDYRLLKTFINDHLEALPADELRRKRERRLASGRTERENERRSDRRWQLPTLCLYIHGRDVDTGEYEYHAHADKMLTHPKETADILKRLSRGEIPANVEDYVYARTCVGNDDHNRQAIEAAHEAYVKFKNFPLFKRFKIMDDIRELILRHKQDLINLFIAEGHPRKLGEWEFSGMLKTYAAESVSFYRSEIARNFDAQNNEIAMLLRKPDGVVCVSPPRNAACSNSILGGFALLGGNAVVIKPPLSLPVSTVYLWRNIIDEALRLNGAPIGSCNIVIGNTAKYLNEWITHPKVNDIIYFGDSDRGLQLGTKMFAMGKKPILELSGKDIMLIWEDADIEGAVESLADCFLGSTQICMVPKMALIHESIYDRFQEKFVDKIKRLKVGLPSDPETCLSPVNKIASFYAFLEDAQKKGAQLIYGGSRLSYRGEPDTSGPYLTPTVLRVDADDKIGELRCVREENFFPLLPLVRVSGKALSRHGHLSKKEAIFQSMLDLVAENAYGLRVSVWCGADSLIRRFIREINNCGLLRINCRHVDFSLYLATHGGRGKTGGPFGELNYFWQKTTHLQGVTVKSSSGEDTAFRLSEEGLLRRTDDNKEI